MISIATNDYLVSLGESRKELIFSCYLHGCFVSISACDTEAVLPSGPNSISKRVLLKTCPTLIKISLVVEIMLTGPPVLFKSPISPAVKRSGLSKRANSQVTVIKRGRVL